MVTEVSKSKQREVSDNKISKRIVGNYEEGEVVDYHNKISKRISRKV